MAKLEELIRRIAPYMGAAVQKGRSFSATWESELEETLSRLFGDDEDKLASAARGYVEFALDGLRLQRRFERDLRYIHKTYADVARAVYHNAEYMESLYLPGILLSHYLWPHHYQQLEFFADHVVPRLCARGARRFADVGVGTGFFSRQLLSALPNVSGVGFDISEHSLAYASRHVAAFGHGARWQPCRQNVIATPPAQQFDAVVSVEVLEHLEDPLSFLKALKGMLAPGGMALITAAITAPNADHIYLYWSAAEVRQQVEAAGFTVLNQAEYQAYVPKASEPVPINGVFACE